jgi:predicted DNA-binding antitoxin AbrB/MazE fold protein
MQPIHAIYENGVFRPIDPVALPESCRVEFEPRIIEPLPSAPQTAAVYAVLSQRFDSGEPDVAARHNEHQP